MDVDVTNDIDRRYNESSVYPLSSLFDYHTTQSHHE
jgi:hypothetical protein